MKLIRYRNIGKRFSKEIDNIVENSIKYFYKDNSIESVSSIFNLEDDYHSSLLYCNDYPFFYIDKKTILPKDEVVSPFIERLDGTRKLTSEDKQKLLTKIMVPRGFLN